jgi:dTDP-4-dehydrorhamnose reductase
MSEQARQPRRLLLLGKNGQVGWELQRSLAPLGEVRALDRAQAPLTDLEGLREQVRRFQPHVVVNAAAYTAVDRAEAEPELAHTINALAPEALAQAAQEVGAWMVHYSTDYVFNGSGSQPWQETDATGPLNVYGRTKLEGEQRMAAACARHVVLRTSWVYAARGGNFVRTMLRLAQEREQLQVVNDQHGAPTGAELIADTTAHIVRQLLGTAHDHGARHMQGIFHLAAAGETTWHGYASHAIAQARALRPDLPWRVQAVAPVPSSAFATAAQRPLNSRLNTTRLQDTFGLHLPHWQAGVDRLLAEILAP